MNKTNEDPDEFVELLRVASPSIAQMIASQMEAEGIPTTTPGSDLKDGYAAAGQLAGLIGCTVCVPAGRLDDARRVLAEAKTSGEEIEASFSDDGPPTPVGD